MSTQVAAVVETYYGYLKKIAAMVWLQALSAEIKINNPDRK
jgi:hypothetical protein